MGAILFVRRSRGARALHFCRRIERMISLQQFVHHRRPQRCCGSNSKSIAHRLSIGISGPNRNCVFLVKTNRPRVAKSTARAGLHRHSFLECERRMRAEAFFARKSLSENVVDDFGRLERSDARHRTMFRRQKFCGHRNTVSRQTCVHAREINQPDLGVAEHKACAVIA